jgi:hypothetical protein
LKDQIIELVPDSVDKMTDELNALTKSINGNLEVTEEEPDWLATDEELPDENTEDSSFDNVDVKEVKDGETKVQENTATEGETNSGNWDDWGDLEEEEVGKSGKEEQIGGEVENE